MIDRHYPDLKQEPEPYLALLQRVSDRQAALVARWLSIGFIHGVMNTDNMTISGESIDFGPCAFLDEYDPMKVFSSIDRRVAMPIATSLASASGTLRVWRNAFCRFWMRTRKRPLPRRTRY